MSMNRNDALTTLAQGVRKFDGYTAQQLLDADWPGLLGLAAADLQYFKERASLPAQDVARACQNRSLNNDGGLAATDALIHLRVSPERKGRWVSASRAKGQKLTDWVIEQVEGAAGR